MTRTHTLDWNDRPLIREVEDRLAVRLDAAADELRRRTVHNISLRGGSNGADAGYPRIRTGRLRRTIFVAAIGRLSRRVLTDASYGAWLETGTRRMKPRPYLSRTLREEGRFLAERMATARGSNEP